MLDSMRKLSGSIASKALMFLLVTSFVVWGVGDILRNDGPAYAVTVGGERVSLADFQRQYSTLDRQLQTLGMREVKASQLKESVIRQLVQQKLNLFAMSDLGLFVPEELVGKKIVEIPEFKDKNGAFSAANFRATLAAQQLNETLFVDSMKKEIAAKFLQDSFNIEAFTLPASVREMDAQVAGETRDIVLLTVPAKAAAPTTDNAALQTYYEQNKAFLYMQPETRTLEYITLSESNLDALMDAAITPEMLEDAKKRHPALDTNLLRIKLQGEQRDAVLHNLGNAIEDELAAGQPLVAALKKLGVEATPKTLRNMAAETAKTSADETIRTAVEQAFSLAPGEISGLIGTPSGTRLMVSLVSITAAEPKAFAAVKDDVAKREAAARTLSDTRARAIAAKEALASGKPWQTVASEWKLNARAISRVARPETGRPAPIAPALQQAVFERKPLDVAGPLAQSNGDQQLAVIVTSNPPQAGTNLSAKATKALQQSMARNMENSAYRSLAERHPVVVNPAILATSPAAP